MYHLEGQRFGRLVAISRVPPHSWLCRCDCGKEKVINVSSLINGSTRSCGCLQADSRKKDITGQRFGRLVAIAPTDRIIHNSVVWQFRCDCGVECEFPIESVLWGGRKSCGCGQLETKKKLAVEMQKNCGREDGTLLCRIKSNTIQRNNTSGARGVYWHNGMQRWIAKLTFRGTQYHGPYRENKDDAIADRKKMEDTYFKPYIDSKKKSGTPD